MEDSVSSGHRSPFPCGDLVHKNDSVFPQITSPQESRWEKGLTLCQSSTSLTRVNGSNCVWTPSSTKKAAIILFSPSSPEQSVKNWPFWVYLNPMGLISVLPIFVCLSRAFHNGYYNSAVQSNFRVNFNQTAVLALELINGDAFPSVKIKNALL